MNDAAREEASKKAYCPNNYKDDGDNVQQVTHDEEVWEKWKLYEEFL